MTLYIKTSTSDSDCHLCGNPLPMSVMDPILTLDEEGRLRPVHKDCAVEIHEDVVSQELDDDG